MQMTISPLGEKCSWRKKDQGDFNVGPRQGASSEGRPEGGECPEGSCERKAPLVEQQVQILETRVRAVCSRTTRKWTFAENNAHKKKKTTMWPEGDEKGTEQTGHPNASGHGKTIKAA